MELESCACGTSCCRIIGKCNKKLGQVAGKVEYQNDYFITTENYVITGNGEDFKEGVEVLKRGENSKGPLVISYDPLP